jgi:SAM-dependent methyltransferase
LSAGPLFGFRGSEVLTRRRAVQAEILGRAYRYWRRRGFPVYRLTDAEIAEQYHVLTGTDPTGLWAGTEVQMSPAARALANMFQPHMWSVPVYKSLTGRFRTPYERFVDDEAFRACLARALRIWPTRFTFRPSTVRRALMTYPNTATPSNFGPTAAMAIYQRFSAHRDRVLDFSAGYGGRLLGALAAVRDYVGIDASRENIRGMERMTQALRRLHLSRDRPTLIHGSAEDVMPVLPARAFALVFSSPPYFSKERYSADERQSWIRYGSYDQWRRRFLRPVIEESRRVLTAGGRLVLNLGDPFGLPIVSDALDLAAKGLTLERVCFLRLGKLPYARRRTLSPFKLEPLLVFVRTEGR